ncbi:MAG: hypothetical protein LKJ37_00965 [Ligilactobacillus acidipiscis]|jgi:predicted transcriptional regulator|nr:hypothetical protein [Ligilactobacillus acidipiscis]MCI1953541.1 hypothetical protein [Ligilactobacillus acidipiscis]
MKIIHNTDVRKMMIDAGMNQTALAGALGITPQRVSQQLSVPLTSTAKEKYMACLKEQYTNYMYQRNRENR